MRKKWVVCMIACLTILLTGCNGNTAKETARNDTDKRISSTAGNTETEKADDTTSVVPETEQPVSSEATTEPSQQEKSDVSSTAGSKTETAKSYESVQVTKKPDSTQEQKQPQQSKPETPKVTEEVKPTKPKPTEEPKQSFDVNPYSAMQGVMLKALVWNWIVPLRIVGIILSLQMPNAQALRTIFKAG